MSAVIKAYRFPTDHTIINVRFNAPYSSDFDPPSAPNAFIVDGVQADSITSGTGGDGNFYVLAQFLAPVAETGAFTFDAGSTDVVLDPGTGDEIPDQYDGNLKPNVKILSTVLQAGAGPGNNVRFTVNTAFAAGSSPDGTNFVASAANITIGGGAVSSSANPSPGDFTFDVHRTGVTLVAGQAIVCNFFDGEEYWGDNAGVLDTFNGTVAPGAANYTLPAATGTYSLTGNSAILKADRKLTAGAGSFVLTGNNAAMTVTPVATTMFVWAYGTPVPPPEPNKKKKKKRTEEELLLLV